MSTTIIKRLLYVLINYAEQLNHKSYRFSKIQVEQTSILPLEVISFWNQLRLTYRVMYRLS